MKYFDEKKWLCDWFKGIIMVYFSAHKLDITLEKIMDMIRRELKYGKTKISKQQLQEILGDDVFDRYRKSQRYYDLINRFIEENLL